MPHHGNEAEHEGGASESAVPEGDALDQAQEILDAAAAENEVSEGSPAAGSSDADAELEGEVKDEAEELRTDLLRLQAEYVNYRKRVERDRAVAGENATISAINALLPVLDDIDAARQHGDLTEGPFASIAAKLEQALTGLGLEIIKDTNVPFDPTIHEALMQVPNAEVPEDHVAQILRNGYRKGERVIRAAQVIVSTGE
jgi:molecular chaperone GrpE